MAYSSFRNTAKTMRSKEFILRILISVSILLWTTALLIFFNKSSPASSASVGPPEPRAWSQLLATSQSSDSQKQLALPPVQPEEPVANDDDDDDIERRRNDACSRMNSVSDIQLCYDPKFVRQFTHNNNNICQNVTTWSQVQTCLAGKNPQEDQQQQGISHSSKPITTIHILGERNSGTKFIMQELQECFPRSIVRTHRDFLRSKHFFQPLVHGDYSQSLIVAIFRHPVQWMAAMRDRPYHAPSHIQGFDEVTHEVLPMEWNEFLTKPWTMDRSRYDLEVERLGQQSVVQCREQFAFPDVVPCRADNDTASAIPSDRYRGFEPIYEMRPESKGQPFQHILELRAAKIVNFLLQIPMIHQPGAFVPVRYEDLLLSGTKPILEQVALALGRDRLPETCRPFPAQPERLLQRRQVPPDVEAWIKEHYDPVTERLLGYI